MPTGYTADIDKGIDFKTFALRCARAFGALVTMRDDDHDAKIPERFEPSDYNARALAAASKRLAELRAMTPAKAEVAAGVDFRKALAAHEKAIADKKGLLRKYQDMRAQVVAWRPPSAEHFELRRFMLDQIDESIRFDCSLVYYNEHPVTRLSGAAWLAEQVKRAERDIEYHTKEQAAEVERCESRTKWVADLRRSLR